MTPLRILLPVIAALLATSPTVAQIGWSALASDRSATAVGDSLTVIILETSSAAASTQSGSRKDTRLSGALSGGQTNTSGNLALQGGFDGRGQVSRSGRLIGQIGVVVEDVLPNGDLRVYGAQTLTVDGERTAIRLRARVRTADISGDNTVVSSRLAEAVIAYDGDGALSRSGEPGLLNRVLSYLGLS